MSRRTRARSFRFRLSVVVLLLGVPAAAGWAHLSSNGTGSGSAQTRTTAALTVSAATPSSPVRPGGQAAVALTVTNPNAVEVRLESLVLDTSRGSNGFAVDAGHSSCGLGSLSFAPQSNGGAGWTIAANGSSTVDLANALSMAVDAANACQGATFTVYVRSGP